MLEQTSKEFGASFLLKLTREIIENTEAYRGFKIKKEVGEFIKGKENLPSIADSETEAIKEIKKEEIMGLVKEKIKKESEKISEMKKEDLLQELKIISRPVQRSAQRPIKKMLFWKTPSALAIPEPVLPETVQYLKPSPTSEEIDLGKLNILIRDPLVKVIECNAPDKNILVMGIMGRKKTPIKLNKEEMDEVLEKFSEAARIPIHGGLFKAAVGSLVISAVISEIVGIQFVIRKISEGF